MTFKEFKEQICDIWEIEELTDEMEGLIYKTRSQTIDEVLKILETNREEDREELKSGITTEQELIYCSYIVQVDLLIEQIKALSEGKR